MFNLISNVVILTLVTQSFNIWYTDILGTICVTLAFILLVTSDYIEERIKAGYINGRLLVS